MNNLCAQNVVSIDNFTGRARVSIPVYTLTDGDLKIPISLDYSAAGIKVGDVNGFVGWNLTAGGYITRILKDLPDEYSNGGWLYGSNAAQVESFTIANGTGSNCAGEIADMNYISANFPANKDAEPDIFAVSAPGLSCQIVFDKDHQPRIIPYRDYTITYVKDANNITSFTITTDQGISFVFSNGDPVTKLVKGSSPYFSREAAQYSSAISYISTWYLSQVKTVKGERIDFTYGYSSSNNGDSQDKVIEKNSAGNFVKNKLNRVSMLGSKKFVTRIQTRNSAVNFNYTTPITDNPILTSISIPGNRTMAFSYKIINQRIFLTSMGETGCDALPPHQFSYHGIDFQNSTSILPDSSSKKQDLWGFYNAAADTILTPKIYVYPYNTSYPNLERYRINPIPNYSGTYFIIPGADRQVNPNTVMSGTLNKIIYPTGGSTLIEYEPNNYYDSSAQSTYNGAGIRVRRITDSDGLNSSNDITKEFSYTNPSTSVTSGKLLHLPSFAFAKPYTGGPAGTQSYWEYSTVRSETDLSIESTDIIYGFVTVKQSGLGKTVYEYSTPGTFWDTSSGDWTPSINYIGRPGCTNSGELANSKDTYPYAPNPNYDFERGLLRSIATYNENNNIVSKSEFTYQRTNSPGLVRGLRIDDLNGFKTYTKYNLITSVDNLNISEKSTVYDLNDVTKSTENLTSYSYTSQFHKNRTKTSSVNSEGVINNTYAKYVKDYSASASGDVQNKALFGLQGQNLNAVVEVYSSIIKPGESEKFMSGKLTKFQTTTIDNNQLLYAPVQNLQFINHEGTTTFQPSNIISGGVFQNDANYIPVVNYGDYNKFGLATTISNKNKSLQSYHFSLGGNVTLANISNARANEVVYSSFEGNEDPLTSFSAQNASSIPDSHTGKSALNANPSSFIQASIKKGAAKNYVFSCWLKPSVAGTISLILTSTSSVIKSYTLPYAISGAWTYYELKVPITEMTDDFTIKAQPSTNLLLDDALFYPENAKVNTFSFDDFYNKTSETNSNGLTMYYEYDRLGRLKMTRDQDKNIIKKETYSSYNTGLPVVAPVSFGYVKAKALDGISLPFTVESGANPCIIGLTYTWNFGDGTAVISSSDLTIGHVFANAGTYNVTLTVSHPVYGSQTSSTSVNIGLRPLNVSIIGTGILTIDNCHIEDPIIGTYPGLPSDRNHTYFNVTSITGCDPGATYTYLWQASSDQINWTTVGTGSSRTTTVNPSQNANSYWIKCTVTSSCGRVGTSEISQFIGYYSSPNCPHR
ncbi:PKD domain-containing protein [Pedobacter sp. HMWF019]|uniref:PKD domain-containing protein n=1 Tax=Pedobacter sp. HMWF019 TaxID=2056856 RepID=UPI001304C2D1|nr:PKD domain-containing protein [Pedobacter sp. HMWF019]